MSIANNTLLNIGKSNVDVIDESQTNNKIQKLSFLPIRSKAFRSHTYTKKKINFSKELLEIESDKQFFKSCIELEFIDNNWQQCSEYESDSAEDETSRELNSQNESCENFQEDG